jgi:hypothetical protein
MVSAGFPDRHAFEASARGVPLGWTRRKRKASQAVGQRRKDKDGAHAAIPMPSAPREVGGGLVPGCERWSQLC